MKDVPSGDEWQELSTALIETGVFLASRISPESLSSIYSLERAFLYKVEIGCKKEIVAFGALWDTENPEWLEMGTIWVADRLRGKGISAEIYNGLSSLLFDLNKSAFLVTKDETIDSIMKGNEWNHADDPYCAPCRTAISSSRNLSEGRKVYYRLAPTAS